jgi:hypothetical protein
MHLKNSRGRPVRLRQPGIFPHDDHFYFDGATILELSRGQYTFDFDAGPEYRTRSGHFEIERHADDTERIEMHRFADLVEEGWYAADLLAGTLRPEEASTVLRAAGLHVLPAVDWKSFTARKPPQLESIQSIADTKRYFGAVGHLNRAVPGLLAFDLPGTISLARGEEAVPPANDFVQRVRADGGHLVVASAADMMLPVYLAMGEVDAVEVITPPRLPAGFPLNLRSPDTNGYRGTHGAGRFAEQIYFHALEAGLRIAPGAGSGAELINDTPFGDARVYVHVDGEMSYDRWWEGLAAGRVFVTNGPLLRPLVRGEPPGHVFRIDDGESMELEIGLNLATREKVDYLEVIKNGRVEYSVPLGEWAAQGGRLPTVEFDASGWFAIRAVTDDTQRYQLALSGPYYVEQAGQPRVSRRAAQFFLDGLDAALADDPRPADRKALEWARPFWQLRFDAATAE